MRKLFCLAAFSAAIQCFPQSYETKFIDQSVITINGESFVTIPDLKKTGSNLPLSFHIKKGSLLISVTGIIDKASPSSIMISLYARESLDNEMLIIATRDSQQVQYQTEGAGSGLYGGNLTDNDHYTINTEFKIIAPGHPVCILVLPLNVHISRTSTNNFIRCFIDGTAYIYNADKKKNRNKKPI